MNELTRKAHEILFYKSEIESICACIRDNPDFLQKDLSVRASELNGRSVSQNLYLMRKFKSFFWDIAPNFVGQGHGYRYYLTDRGESVLDGEMFNRVENWIEHSCDQNNDEQIEYSVEDIMIFGMTLEQEADMPKDAQCHLAAIKACVYLRDLDYKDFSTMAKKYSGTYWKEERNSYQILPKWADLCLAHIQQTN